MSMLDDDDALAAELALGTLSADELAAARARQAQDAIFSAAVREWENRLAPLIDSQPDIAPDTATWLAIRARIEAPTQSSVEPLVPASGETGTVVVLRRQVTRWRLATALCSALAALLALWIATSATLRPPSTSATYMAALQQNGAGPAFLVSLDLASRRMTIVPADTTAQPDHSYELWMIPADAKPQSLGVVDEAIKTPLPDIGPDRISKATYAVTIEPKGGSPSGQPTSAPVFTGHLLPMKPQAR